MVLKAEPFVDAVAAIRNRYGPPDAVVLMSPQGRSFSHEEALRLSRLRHVALLCGRYEGVDERVRNLVATEEISIGDYVLTGGELPAAVVVDAVARFVPGVVGDARSVDDDSFVRGLFDHPHFTRPAVIDAHAVPDVLLSGHHGEIRRWRKREALKRTLARRPDLLDAATLDGEDREILEALKSRVREE
jgi:tRNA (guanine37-N1)-methyltransferase